MSKTNIMNSVRRLFVFAAFDPDSEVKDSLKYYLSALAKLGDISFCADCRMQQTAVGDLGGRLVHFQADKHGEYDFGSYKRAFFAPEVKLSDYDFIYFLNDSVYGPLFGLEEYLQKMEALGTGAFGLVMNSRRSGSGMHLHSWFLGFKPCVFMEGWFQDFLNSVQKEKSKIEVCVKYEEGLSTLLKEKGIDIKALFYVNRKKIYNSPLALYKKGLPFVKKDSFKRHNGCLEGQLDRLLGYTDPKISSIIRKENPDLCTNPFILSIRYLSYLANKITGSRKLDRFLLSSKRVLLGHVFNPYYFNREKSRQRRYDVYGSAVPEYLAKHYPVSAEDTVFFDFDKKTGKEKTFVLWFQGEDNAPQLIKNCFCQMRKFCTDSELVILDRNTIKEYTDIPACIWEKFNKGKIGMAHFSDICRVDLLYRHGGCWIDSTCHMTGPVPLEIRESDFFAYMAGHDVKFNYSYIQNCFLHAKKGSRIIALWRQMMLDYWEKENSKVDYFQHQLMFKVIVQNIPEAAEEFSRMPKIDQRPTHELWFKRGNEAFDQDILERVKSESFFQKTTYNLGKVIPGSFKEYFISPVKR